MEKRHATVVATFSALTVLGLAAIGCGKSEGTSTGTATVTGAATGGSSGCADRLTSLNKKGDADKKVYATACDALSEKARTCIADAKSEKDLDACVTDKADKEKLFAVILGAAMEQSAKKAAGPAAATKLEKIGVALDVPGEISVSDGIDKNSQMILGASVGGLNVGEAGRSVPKTLAAAKSEAKMFKPKNVKGETEANGYWLTFENTGSLGTNYWVRTRREFGKKAYECSASVDTQEKADAALAACKTLRLQ